MIQKLVSMNTDSAMDWMDLCGRLRQQADALLDSEPPASAAALNEFVTDVRALCEHVELVHDEMTRVIDALEESESQITNSDSLNHEIDLAAVETQRETHELRADPFDILKALLMWRDDPAERIQKRV